MLETVGDLLEEKKFTQTREILCDMNPADIGELFNELDEKQFMLAFRLLPKELAAEVFVELDPDLQEQLIVGFSDNELREVLDELFLDDTVDIIEEMPANVVSRILKATDPDKRKQINRNKHQNRCVKKRSSECYKNNSPMLFCFYQRISQKNY